MSGGSFFSNPLQAFGEVVANVSTGGLYGAGQALANGGQIGSAINNLGPWGATVHPISPQIADIGNAIGAGAGIGGGLTATPVSPTTAAAGGTVSGATPATISPYYFGFEPSTLASAGTSEFGQFAGGIPTAGMVGAPAAGAAAGAAGSSMGPLLGASAAQQAMQFLGGASPLAMPAGGAMPTAGGPATPSQQQLALMASQQNDPYRGLAPRFEQRMTGTRESPGIATLPLTSDYYRQ